LKLNSFKVFLIFILITTSLFSATEMKKRILVTKLDKGIYRMRIYFNYENPFNVQDILRGRFASHFVTLPIPNRFDVKKMTIEVLYTPSLVLYEARSTISVVANGSIVKQFPLNEKRFKDSGKIKVKTSVPIDLLKDYNQIGVQIIQHYSKGISEAVEDTSAPELWSQIDLQNSYFEIDFKLKPFEEKISSISKFMFDPKNILKDSVNFVFPKRPTDQDFYHYAFMANQIGDILKFRDIDFSVTTKLLKNRNNVLIMKRDEVKNVLKQFADFKDLDKKISGNINLIRNPKRADKGILVITGKTDEELKNGIYRLVNRDLFILEEQNIKVYDMEIPPKSEPFSAPGFIKTGEKILFSDLGYKTRTFVGEMANPLHLYFKLYPTIEFERGDSVEATLNIIHGGIIRADSATNIYLNGVLAYQVRTKNNKDEDRLMAVSAQRFELSKKSVIPAKLLYKGKNVLKIEFAMVPIDGPALVRFNNEILKLTLRDDSWLYFPKGKTEVELPNLKYASDLAFPFSIYPDLQRTGILITDFDSRTIASAMYVSFYLGKIIDYPAYRLTITADINKVINKDIISIGKQIPRYALLYKNAPIRFTKDGIVKEIALNSKYVKFNKNRRIKQYTATTKMIESINFNDYLISQMYKSPFNRKRVVLEFSSNNPKTLIKGVRNGFKPSHIGNFKGDIWLYNIKTNKSFSFRLKETYILDEVIDD